MAIMLDYFGMSHSQALYNTSTHMHLNLPLMRSLIWDWTCPFSRFWTTVLAILVRWPMLPLLAPPSALEISEANKPTTRERESMLWNISLIKDGYLVKNWSSSYWILSFSSQAFRILCTKRHCWKSCTTHTDRKTSYYHKDKFQYNQQWRMTIDFTETL